MRLYLFLFVTSTAVLGKIQNTNHKMRHSYIRNPCSLPSISEVVNFKNVCTDYLKIPYICLPHGKMVSQTEMEELERFIAGQFKYCRYDLVTDNETPIPIGDHLIWRKYEELVKRKKDEKRKRGGRNQDENDSNQHKERNPLDQLRLMARRPVLGITFLSGTDLRTDIKEECMNRYSNRRSTHFNNSMEALEFYANVARLKWSHGECVADIALLVIERPKVKNKETKLHYVYQIALSENFTNHIGQNVTDLLERFNDPTRETTMKLSLELHGFFKRLIDILNEEYPNGPERKIHYVPSWALATFVACILLTVSAAALGTWVTSKKGSRSSIKAPGANNRKWKAGFSGGMWAS